MLKAVLAVVSLSFTSFNAAWCCPALLYDSCSWDPTKHSNGWLCYT